MGSVGAFIFNQTAHVSADNWTRFKFYYGFYALNKVQRSSRFRTLQKTLLVRWRSCFVLPGSGSAEHGWKLSRLLFKSLFCCHKCGWNASRGLIKHTLRFHGYRCWTQSWTVVSCLAVQLSHHSHLVRPPTWKSAHIHLMWRWYDT